MPLALAAILFFQIILNAPYHLVCFINSHFYCVPYTSFPYPFLRLFFPPCCFYTRFPSINLQIPYLARKGLNCVCLFFSQLQKHRSSSFCNLPAVKCLFIKILLQLSPGESYFSDCLICYQFNP